MASSKTIIFPAHSFEKIASSLRFSVFLCKILRLISDSTETIRLLDFGLRPRQLSPHRNIELVIELLNIFTKKVHSMFP